MGSSLGLGPGAQEGETEGLPADRTALLEALSEELLNDLPMDVWRKLFLGPAYDTIRFAVEACSLLACDLAAAEWSEADVRTLASRFEGCVEQCGARTVISFDRPRAALDRLTQRALVTTEYQGEEVISASVTLAPPPRADLSTFAGLGLV